MTTSQDKEVLTALQEFKTCFDLAKSSAGSLCKASDSPNSDSANKDQTEAGVVGMHPPPTLEVPEVIEDFLKQVSKTGVIRHPWKVVKPLLLYKLNDVMRWYNERQPLDSLPPVPNYSEITFKQIYTSIVRAVDTFKQAPFTVQRLCELICNPEQHYKRIDKFLHALEKNTTIVTTVDETGRKLCTAAETELPYTDSQHADKLLALFDWLSSSSTSVNGTVAGIHESLNPEPTSTSKRLAELDILSTNEPESDSKNQTNADCSISLTSSSTSNELTQETGPKSVKRSLCEDGDAVGEAGHQSSKRVRLDDDSLQADSTMAAGADTEARFSPDPAGADSESSLSDMAFQGSCGEDVTSHSSDTAPDSMAEELPMDSEQTEPSTGISDGAEAVPTEPQPTISEETEAKVPASSTTITAAVVGESHTEGSAEAGPTVSEIIARAVQHEAMSGPSTTATVSSSSEDNKPESEATEKA